MNYYTVICHNNAMMFLISKKAMQWLHFTTACCSSCTSIALQQIEKKETSLFIYFVIYFVYNAV